MIEGIIVTVLVGCLIVVAEMASKNSRRWGENR